MDEFDGHIIYTVITAWVFKALFARGQVKIQEHLNLAVIPQVCRQDQLYDKLAGILIQGHMMEPTVGQKASRSITVIQ